MNYHEWTWKLRKMVQCWKQGMTTMLVLSNYQDIKFTKSGTKLVSKIHGLKCDKIIFDDVYKQEPE